MRNLQVCILVLICLLLAGRPKAQRAVAKPIKQSRIFVRVDDVDCESGRFKSRLVRELKREGAVLVDTPETADVIAEMAITFGARPLRLTNTSTFVTVRARGGTPFTTTTDWRSTESTSTDLEVLKTVEQNITAYGMPVKTLELESVKGIDSDALAKDLVKNGYRLVKADADLELSVVVKSNLVDDEEDFATVHYVVRDRRTGFPFSNDVITKSDPHTYAMPLDVLASAAIDVAKSIPAKLPRSDSRR